MIDLPENDFVPFGEFGLAWRFNDPTHHLLPAEALADLRPIRPSRAASLRPSLEAACAAFQRGAGEPVIRIDAEDLSEPALEAASAALGTLPIAGAQRVIVSWNRDDALETSWSTFRTYWDDFCYPSSDDATIVPLNGGWVLCYHHWKQFSFRVDRLTGDGPGGARPPIVS